MDEYFTIPVTYAGKELEFEARLLLQGYVHKIEIILDEIPVLFEPDEERNYRALVSPEQLEGKGKHLNKGVLEAIANVLHTLPDA